MKYIIFIVALGTLWVHYYTSTVAIALFYAEYRYSGKCETYFIDYEGFNWRTLQPVWNGACEFPAKEIWYEGPVE